jgi:predicted Rossmann fold nucleotide-binding protein DprA/Smf involved in DNA uptake
MKPAALEPDNRALGNSSLLGLPLAALFCSARCPGKVILRAYDLAAQLRDSNRAVISGFHTPVEKECLAILMRGKSPMVICPARSLERFRVPTEWKQSLAEGRLLIVSPFRASEHRATAELAERRNEFVASLATEIIVLHATPGGRLAKLLAALEAAGRSVTRL